MIKLYVLIWGLCSLDLHRKMEGNPDFITHIPIYVWLLLFKKIKMCTSRIYHISNGYYSSVISTRILLWLGQGQDEPAEEYYSRFESSISTAELAKFTTSTHIELNRRYAVRNNNDGTRRSQAMFLLMLVDSEKFSGVWDDLKNNTLLDTENYPKTSTNAYNVLCRYKNITTPLPQSPPSSVEFLQSNYPNST